MTQEALFQVGGVPVAGARPTAGEAVLAEVLAAGATWRRSAFAKLEECRRCGALTLYAADMGWDLMTEARVDLALLDRGLEVEALLAGRGTAELEVMRHGGGPLVFTRDRWLVRKDPAARRRLWVPHHVCGVPLGYPLPLAMVFPFEFDHYARSLSYDTKCPF